MISADSTQAWRRFETHVDVAEAGQSAVDCLSHASGLSKQEVKRAMTKGAVWISKGAKARRLRRAKSELKPGDTIDFYYDERVLSMAVPTPVLIADETAYSVWHKPFGMLSQGSKWGDHCAITRCAEKTLSPERPALSVHRIDRAATGLIIIAHQKRAAAALSKLFHDRNIEKHYRAVVHGRLPEPEVELSIDTAIEGRDALTRVTELATNPRQQRSLLDVRIETGRKHQIRIHLAGIGLPIVGDRLYGETGDRDDLQLTAYRLEYDCPITGVHKRFELDEKLLPKF